MQQRSDPVAGNFVLFLVLSFAILFGYSALMSYLHPPQEPPNKGQQAAADKDAKKDEPGEGAEQKEPQPREDQPEKGPPEPEEGPKSEGPEIQAPQPEVVEAESPVPRRWITLGSVDEKDPYRMLVTLTNRGAAVARIELSSHRYHDLEDRSGYLGHLVIDETVLQEVRKKGVRVQAVGPGTPEAEAGLKPDDLIVAVGKEKIQTVAEFRLALRNTGRENQATLTVLRDDAQRTLSMAVGALVQVVGPGTPAAKAGLKPGDLIVAVNNEKIIGVEDLRRTLARKRRPKQITLTVRQVNEAKPRSVSVTLERQPLEVIRPEENDFPSFLLTLERVQGKGIGEFALDPPEKLVEVGKELEGLDLWSGNWEVDESDQTHARFSRVLPKLGLELTKTYRLAKVPEESMGDGDYEAYHLEFDVEIRNQSGEKREVAYQLDGPNGLPAEGAWYAYKVGRGGLFSGSGPGLRDVVVSFERNTPSLVGCAKIADAEIEDPWQDESLTYLGVDAQYFSCVFLPQKDSPEDIWFARSHPLLIGKVNEKHKNVTNTSCRLISEAHELAPDESLSHRFVIFAGPKKPALLANEKYQLGELVYYGWFSWFAKPMAKILHVFYALVGNYGLAILMLTILVRGCMFPMSRKQALGAQKMQELQPEIKRIQEQYKNNMEGRTKAQQELFRKHKYNPLSGCLVLFVQLPIFVALYRSLSVDVELRGAPLLWEGFPWCPNLSAPDMLWDWSGFMPGLVVGWCPYFNLLPILTIILFILQQKMFMPPPADDQAAMQQKIMKYMMIFIGFLFFKVPSGLCVYFVASSLWGLGERKFLPKHTPADKPQSRADAKAKAKPEPKPAPKPAPAPAPKLAASDGDGAAARRKKKKSKRGKR